MSCSGFLPSAGTIDHSEGQGAETQLRLSTEETELRARWSMHAPVCVAVIVLESLSQTQIFRTAATCRIFHQASETPRLFKRLQLRAVGLSRSSRGRILQQRNITSYTQFLAQPRFALVEELDLRSTGTYLSASSRSCRYDDLISNASRSCRNVRVLKVSGSVITGHAGPLSIKGHPPAKTKLTSATTWLLCFTPHTLSTK